MSFFLDGDATDLRYRNIRAAAYRQEQEAKDLLESLWSATGEFLDNDLRTSARIDLLPRFWEMYVARALQVIGLQLVPTAKRDLSSGGPDLQLATPHAYVECVAATGGTGADAVQPPEPFVVTYVPREGIILRLRSALSEKLAKFNQYRAKGVLGTDDPYVVAINGSRIPMARGEPTMPYIVSAVLPFGKQRFHLDVTTLEVLGTSFESEYEVLKASGASVATDVFLNADHSGISAVIYGWVDEANHGRSPGDEFIVVHNPGATNPLPIGVLPGFFEFWVDDEYLRVEDRRPSAT